MQILALLLMFFSLTVSANERVNLKVDKYKLKNGLTVLLYQDHSVPLVNIQQWVKVGSVDEKPGRTGLAHFFEHIMFKGTDKYPEEKLKQSIEGNGGKFNAFTTNDYTGYHVTIPKQHLKLLLDIESDRLKNLQINQPVVNTEREVVKEERRLRVENSVQGTLWEAVFKSAFKVSNYRWPVIGYMSDLNSTSISDFKAFYKKFYSPNNTILVVSGDFDKNKARAWIEKFYGPIKSSKIKRNINVKEPEQKAQREVVIKKPVQSVSIVYAYKVPKLGTKEALALDILSQILGSGQSSRLYRSLEYKEQKVSSVWAYNYSLMQDGVFLVSAELRPGVSVTRTIRSLDREINKLRKHKVTAKELDKVRNRLQYSIVARLKTLEGKGYALADAEMEFGDYKEIFNSIDRYESITAQDVLNVANKYLSPQRRSLIKIIPQK